MDKRIVIPGEWLTDDPARSGQGTYVKEGNVYASVCGLLVEKSRVSVIPFAGPYMPRANDLVIGYVTTVTPSNWIFDIGCPYEALLHVSEYPLRVASEDMADHFDVGDAVVLRVQDVNAEMKIELTYKDQVCRKLKYGMIIDVPVSKISRVIGRSGSMVSMLKSKTGCSVFVGYNGRIWADGPAEDCRVLSAAIGRILEQAHLSGLTDKIARYIDDLYAGDTDAPVSADTVGSVSADDVSAAQTADVSVSDAAAAASNRPNDKSASDEMFLSKAENTSCCSCFRGRYF